MCFGIRKKVSQVYHKEKKTPENIFHQYPSIKYERQFPLEISLFSVCSLRVIVIFLFEQLCANTFHPMSICRKSLTTVNIWKEVQYRGRATHTAGTQEFCLLTSLLPCCLTLHEVLMPCPGWKLELFTFSIHPFSKHEAFLSKKLLIKLLLVTIFFVWSQKLYFQ